MCKLCVFGGTTEGRKLTEFLAGQGVKVTACVATEYGEELLEGGENLVVSARRLPKDDILALFQQEHFDLVIDATHPYATSITESVASACTESGIEYLRLLREEGDAPADAVYVDDIAGAVDYLNSAEGNILLTTGSKELANYRPIKNFAERVYARVLPMTDSVEACRQAGLKTSHIIAMQGPFSLAMNVAMLQQIAARFLVTKDGGSTGGFDEKAEAALSAGVKLVVIGRPARKVGLGLNEVVTEICRRFNLRPMAEVAVVGIGPGSRQTMTAEAAEALYQADCLIGAKRMVDSARRPGQAAFYAVAPGAIAGYIAEHSEYQRPAVVMSGDVGFFSGTKKLLPLLGGCKVRVLPGLNSCVYLCSKIGASYEDALTVSLHGREHNIVADVRRNSKVFALVGGDDGMQSLCQTLCAAGLGDVKMSIGERLSYADEKITIGPACKLANNSYDSLSVALIENGQAGGAITHGLPDDAFLRSAPDDKVVPMTKSEVRSVCLSKLGLTRKAVCWDIGAGTGSVAVEMALLADGGQVYAIEQKPNAVELLNQNRAHFGVNNLHIVAGSAPQACLDLPAPDFAFIGGSSGNMRPILDLLLAKNPGCRIVATAIALESVAELTACLKDYAFAEQEVACLNVSRGRSLGAYNLLTAQNPIFIFTMQNPQNPQKQQNLSPAEDIKGAAL